MKVAFSCAGRVDRSAYVSELANTEVEVAIPFDHWASAPSLDDLWDLFTRFVPAFLGWSPDWRQFLEEMADEYPEDDE